MKVSELAGRQFGRLTVTGRSEHGNGEHSYWQCACDCGTAVTVRGIDLRSGHTASCGCLMRQLAAARLKGRTRFTDLNGQRFKRLFVRSFAGRSQRGMTFWWAECQLCGRGVRVSAATLRKRRDCGCQRKPRKKTIRHGHAIGRGSGTYVSWLHAKDRCSNPRHPQFADYGLRGVRVCKRWRDSFEAFIADMGERPAGTTLDRLNPNLGYFPGNTRWATPKQQSQTTRKRFEAVALMLRPLLSQELQRLLTHAAEKRSHS